MWKHSNEQWITARVHILCIIGSSFSSFSKTGYPEDHGGINGWFYFGEGHDVQI